MTQKLMGKMDRVSEESPLLANGVPPATPPLPGPATTSYHQKGLVGDGKCYSVNAATRDLWDQLFDNAYGADLRINTDNGGILYAHASLLGMSSPVMKGMLKQTRGCGRRQAISIRGVPHDAVRVFIRFLYSSCYEQEEMEEFAVPLLVLSHAYVIPHLKRVCVQHLEHGLLTIDNVTDIFQLALLCDAPRLGLICHRMILKNFKAVADTEGWKAMKKSHPILEKEILESFSEAQTRQKQRVRRLNERKIYLQLYEAMEALVHICRDGCRTIGPHDKVFKEDQAPCRYEACKGLELLVRHFAGCKLRVPGGCIHCKRMWQLLELHSCLCSDSDMCRVPVCRSISLPFLLFFLMGDTNSRGSPLVDSICRLILCCPCWWTACRSFAFHQRLKLSTYLRKFYNFSGILRTE